MAQVSSFFLLVIFVIAIVCGFYALVPPPTAALMDVGAAFSDHADVKHGADATGARQCGLSPQVTMKNFITNRFADVCLTDAGWGVFVYEVENGTKREVTSFIKNKMKSLDQVLRYLGNAGYIQ